jgi:esterase/lipase
LFGDTLADAGIPVMRFDYYGTNDSLGEDRESTVDRWLEDIRTSYQELQRRTGADIMVFGIRTGALMALKGLSGLPVGRWVLWDPISNGFNHHQHLSAMQKNKVWRTKTLRGFNKPKKLNGGEELLGFTYSLQAIKELKELRNDDIEVTDNASIQLVHTINMLNDEDLRCWQQLFKVSMHHVEVNCNWLDPIELTTAITDQRIAYLISKLFMEYSV